jgi:integrase
MAFFSFPIAFGSFTIVFSTFAYRLLTGCFMTGEHMRIKLTPAFCKNALAQAGAERTIFWDTTMPGFGLVVTSAGHRGYVVQYRAGGRSRRMAIDGVLSLAGARKRAKQLLGQVAHDRDPLAERRKAVALQEDTFQAIAESYLARDARKRNLRSTDWVQAALKRLVYPQIGKLAISEIRRSDIVRLLDRIEDERGPVMADRALAIIRRIMNWHASRSDDDDFRTPIVRGMARTSDAERARKRILTDDEIRAVWRAAEAHLSPFTALVQFLLLTGARRSEAAEMTWGELSGADWTLPAARNKVAVDLIRPLSPAAMAVLKKLPKIRRYVFTSNGRQPLGGFTHFKRRLDIAAGVSGYTLHDLRRTARSLMSRAGVNSDHAERCLGHVIGGVRGVYDRYEFHEEKRRAYEVLAGMIERIINPVDNVLPLQRRDLMM